jgi:hypothetical protein
MRLLPVVILTIMPDFSSAKIAPSQQIPTPLEQILDFLWQIA